MLRLRLILLPLTLFPGSSAGISFYTSIWILYCTEYLFARWSLFTVCLNVWLYFSIRTKYKVLKNKIFYINIDLQNIWKAFIHLKVQRKMWRGDCFLPPANRCCKHAGNWRKKIFVFLCSKYRLRLLNILIMFLCSKHILWSMNIFWQMGKA